MPDFAELVRTTLPPSVEVHAGRGGLPRLVIRTSGAAAEVYFQGAHVTGWHPAAAPSPVLWLSGKSMFEPGRPIRGGVPVCFPWFGAHPGDPAAPPHGFARLRPWTLIRAHEDTRGSVTLELELAGEDLSPRWPHGFRVRHRIAIGAALRMELDVQNPGRDAFTFEEALHTYFAVSDVRRVTIAGLEGVEYLDKVAGLSRNCQAGAVRFTGETDRIYLDTRAACVIDDREAGRRISIAKTGSDSTVVWNPWIDKARAMPDFGDDEWPGMVCVETCNVNVHARTLAPGESHTMTALIEVQ